MVAESYLKLYKTITRPASPGKQDTKNKTKMNPNVYYLIPAAILLLTILVYVMMTLNRNRKVKDFIARCPDACMVKLKMRHWLIYYEKVILTQVDGGEPLRSGDGFFSSGFCVAPGTHVLQVSFEKQRPGVFHKTVTTTYDPVNIEVTVEPGRNYILSFNKKRETYELVENQELRVKN